MVTSRSDTWNQLMELLNHVDSVGAKRLLKKSEYTVETDLVDDLGLVGDDAFEFMEAFAARFAVEKGDYATADYFESEGLWLLPSLKKRAPKLPVTLGMLKLAADAGVWDKEKLQQARIHKRY